MKFKIFSRGLGLAAIASINLFFFPQIAEAQPIQRPPELDRLAYFEGTWRCEQQGDFPITLTWNVKRDLNDFWYVGYAEEMRSPTNPNPVNGREFLGYDADSQRLIRLLVVSNGGLLQLTSWGWENEELVWEGTLIAPDGAFPLREVITRERRDRFAATYFVRNAANEGWQAVINETCDRQS